MTDPSQLFESFAQQYAAALEHLRQAAPQDTVLGALAFAEALRVNSGADEYVPEWLGPFLSIVAQGVARALDAALDEASGGRLREALAPALLRALQLGYTEGWSAAKDD